MIPGLLAAVAFCIVAGVALFAEVERQADGWGRVSPGFYAGPISNITQPFRAQHNNLSRIDLWAFIDDGGAGGVADVLARVIPHGAQAPIRKSRVAVHHQKGAGATVAMRFAPIPDSQGKLYTVALSVLSGPGSFLFVGITSSDMNPAGQASINGNASRAHLDLAMRPYWVGRGGRVLEHLIRSNPWRLFLIVDAALWGFVMVSAISAAWTMHRPRHWRQVVRDAVQRGALISAVIATCALALILMLSAVPHA